MLTCGSMYDTSLCTVFASETYKRGLPAYFCLVITLLYRFKRHEKSHHHAL